MKLIDAPIGIFRFDGELVLKTEYKSENKLSGKYIPDCYIVRTGEYFWGGAKTANELNNLDVEPVDFAELLPTVTDTISRQAAIEACGGYLVPVNIIKQLPSAQPEHIKGHWVDDCTYMGIQCSACGKSLQDYIHATEYAELMEVPNYCPNCGSDNRGVTE